MTGCPRCLLIALVLTLACAFRGPVLTACAQSPPSAPDGERAASEEDTKQLRKKKLDEMRQLAETTTVRRLNDAKEEPAKLAAEPVLRYSGQFHGILDATMWVYGTKGRPLAAHKIEFCRAPWLNGYYSCVASLSDGLIDVQWPDQPRWSSTKPGVEMRELSEAPKPASTEAARTRQMREAIRRFSATRINAGNIREENRLLAQPVHRYRDPDSGLQDGAIFAWIANGTNPDFLLLIEMRGPDLAQATWRYGAVRMTTGELHLRLDDKEVWTVPWEWAPGRNVYPTYVHGPRQGPDK